MDQDYGLSRFNMVEQQIAPWNVDDRKVLDLFLGVKREDFVPASLCDFALCDKELPIGHGQYTMTPKVEARMLQSLKITSEDHVLEIGTGMGFVTALMAVMARTVTSLDIVGDFIDHTKKQLTRYGITNVECLEKDGLHGTQRSMLYDVIAVTGSLSSFYTGFSDRLKSGGRLFLITGNAPTMRAHLFTRCHDGKLHQEYLFDTLVAPLQGKIEEKYFQL